MATESLPERTPGSAPRPELEARRGMRLGRYELLWPIAAGGMAQVWIAEQHGELGFRRLVAVKTIRPEHAESSSFRRMFLDEARLAARLHHANVVEVIDLGEEGPIVFQAMTLVEGDSISGLLRRWHLQHARDRAPSGLPACIAVRIVADALRGLHAAHELTDDEGVPLRLIHRDVSPQNILVGVDGTAKIADFGIAKALGRLSDETEAGQVKGKFSYMAPEQVERLPPDRRSDLFAAGVVLWEALTGARLFRGVDVIDTLSRVRTMRIPDVREVVPALGAPLAAVVARALARDRDARFETAAELADALEDAARAARVSASTKEVAALVWDLTGADVERQREGVRASRGGGSASGPQPGAPIVASAETFRATTIADEPRPRRPTRKARAWIMAGVGGAAAAAIGAVVVVPRLTGESSSLATASTAATATASTAATATTTTTATATTTTTTTATATATTTTTATTATTATTTTTTTATAAASSSSPLAPSSATVARSTRPKPPPPPASTAPPPQPKFGNPYGPK